MIVVDSSVWVDYFSGTISEETERLDALLGTVPLAIGDVILAEVLQGFRRDRDFEHALSMLSRLTVFPMLGAGRAVAAARRYRELRGRGVTVRKTADIIIASFCISEGHSLLFSDRDFEPCVEHLGLVAA